MDAGRAETVREKFSRLDANKDGKLSFEELVELLKRGNPDMSRSEIKRLYDRTDKNGDGSISFSEFVAFLQRPAREPGPYGGDHSKLSSWKNVPKATIGAGGGHGGGVRKGIGQLRARYKRNDMNGDGRIDLEETKHLLLSQPGTALTEQQVERLFRACDRDNSGTIEIEELYDFCFTGDRMTDAKYALRDAFSSDGRASGPGDYDLSRVGVNTNKGGTIARSGREVPVMEIRF
eukprot:TRINITY_DN22775_c0_g1_i1.p1 TRINITY_DN22775_c0_g1~~TRINITY_DN22775_c0_g1_i1.p1  ORF type:complete len:234 (+),score=44.84 TRINITY_DN22775_c0_g1_i1:55-756(+)